MRSQRQWDLSLGRALIPKSQKLLESKDMRLERTYASVGLYPPRYLKTSYNTIVKTYGSSESYTVAKDGLDIGSGPESESGDLKSKLSGREDTRGRTLVDAMRAPKQAR